MSTAKVIQFPSKQPEQAEPQVTGARVADCDDGYTRLANEILEASYRVRMNGNAKDVLMAIVRMTYGWNKVKDRIAGVQIADETGLNEEEVSRAIFQLRTRKIILIEGDKRKAKIIAVNKNVSEWVFCKPQKDVAQTRKISCVNSKSELRENANTKDILPKTDKTPISPCGDLQSASAELPDAGDKKKSSAAKQPVINYQAFADSYNEILGDRLPTCAVMNDKRKRALKKLLPLLKAPTLECFSAYLNAFAHTARPFYFGDNDRGWRASFDFVLRQDTLTATKEGSIADSRLEIEGDDE